MITETNIMDGKNCIVYDAKSWKNLNPAKKKNLSYTYPIVFQDKILLLNSYGRFKVTYSLEYYDGKSTHLIPFKFDFVIDMLVKDKSLSILMIHKKKFYIAVTEDLQKWQLKRLLNYIKRPLSIEKRHENYIIGTVSGSIFIGN